MQHRYRSFGLASFPVLLLIALVRADAPAPPSPAGAGATLHFVTSSSVDCVKLLPAPPKLDTQEHQEELASVLRLQETRTDAEVARAKSEKKLTLDAFQTVLGHSLTAEKLPNTVKLIKAAESDSKLFSGLAKEKFARPRPARDPRVKPAIDGDDEPSYPSGHSTRGTLFALILAEIDPENREALIARGQEIGWDRVIAGVHYPSDVFAGRVLGQSLFQSMMTNTEFLEALENAKKEFAAAAK